MNTNVTLSVRSLLLGALVLLALVVAYLLGGTGGGTSAQAADSTASAADPHRVVTMTGTGEASAVPDQLSFALGVTLTRPTLDAALADANKTMQRVLGALADDGVTKSDVQTTGLSMNPVYDYHQYGPPTIRGYHVSERARVLVEDLTKGGTAVSAAVAAGGNDARVSDIRLLVGDTDGVMKKARDAAVDEATAKAEQYAEASGDSLGDVVTIREVRSKPLPTPTTPFAYNSSAALDSAALGRVPIRAGKDNTSVTVQIVWSLA